jgi:RecA/RadA recombinase
MNIKKLKSDLLKKEKSEVFHPEDFLSTGSTLLNLACTDRAFRGFAKGHYYFIVGDSTSGKTFLSLTCLAEACKNPNFKNHRFIYDSGEFGALMNIGKFFGQKVADKLEAPSYEDKKNPIFSYTIEEFYYHIDDAVKKGKPFIYILDSMDSLSSEAELEKFNEQKNAFRKGRQVAGSYGDGKAKKNSTNIRKLLKPLKDSGSILIIISQTRDNLGFGFEKKTRSGGNSLRFYSTIELWSSVRGKISKVFKGIKRQLGIICQIQIKKNRICGKERTVEIPIYHSYGIDDIGSCIDYLIKEGCWKKKGGSIVAKDWGLKHDREKLIQIIEEKGWENKLRILVSKTWNEIEDSCKVQRKPRYE